MFSWLQNLLILKCLTPLLRGVSKLVFVTLSGVEGWFLIQKKGFDFAQPDTCEGFGDSLSRGEFLYRKLNINVRLSLCCKLQESFGLLNV